MIPLHLVEIVERAIVAPDSKIDRNVLALKGWGTPKVSHFLNNVCAFGECRYLEFGTWCGRSLIAASHGNSGVFVGVDNFTPSPTWGIIPDESRKELAKNLAGRTNIVFHDMDWHQYGVLGEVPPPDVFFYDAGHSEQDTMEALVHVKPLLKNPSLIIVDDYENTNFPHVPLGVIGGLKNGKYVVHKFWKLPKNDGWHQGLWVGVVGD